ncbi:MAG: HD domain-containing protein [Oscillospiraceae bacterium]|nr:HD domain-containing protein [Oscillospiraceae bacterium]
MKRHRLSFHIGRLFLCLFSAVFAVSCLLIPSRDVYADTIEDEKGYFTFLYDNSNGLSASEANAVAQTDIGFIWIGGYSGLTRYEGMNFTHFDLSTGIANVNCLFVDSKDRLWIGTNDSGIAVRQNAQFRFWGKSEGLNSLSIRSIAEDGAGNIVAASTEGIGYIDSDGIVHHLQDDRIKDKYVRRLKVDIDGVIYGITMDNCIFALENLEITSFYTPEELGIKDSTCITPDPNERGKVYIGTGSSNIICGNMFEGMRNKKTLSAAPNEYINDILFASDNKIWVASNNGLGYFNENMKYKELKNSAMTSTINSIMEDFEGNIWCASSRQGVMKVVRSPFVDITGISGLDHVVVNTTYIYQDELYIGTDVGLQLLDKYYNQKTNVLTDLLKGVRIRSIKADSAGNLWLCTYSTTTDYGLICYHGDGTYDIFNEAAGMVSNKVRTLTELSDGTIAVASSGGVNLIKDGRITDTINEEDGIANTEILSIAEGDDGSIYFGSDGGGLYILKDKTLRSLGLDDGLKSQVIKQLHKDKRRGIYWIVTSNSIAYMKNEVIHTLSNFPYSNNSDMQFDANGGIWILSSNGIYFVNGDDLLSDSELLYSFYDIRSGLPSIATSNSRSYISPEGTLYIAGSSGVSSININTAREGKNDVRLTVPFIEIDGEEIFVKEGDTIFIPSGCKRLTIYAYAMTYAHNPQVSYYIEGFDDKPTVVAKHEMKPISFTRPHSGEYVFHMSIIDVMTGKEVNSIAVNITVEKELYENWWFWLIIAVVVALVAFLIIWAFIRHKMSKLIRKEKENQTFIRELIQVFAKSIDVKDQYTNGHSSRVAEYTKMIAEKVGYSETEVEKFYNIGLMHDIGKILVPNEVLNKPGRLDEAEFLEMKKHAINGYNILKEVDVLPELALGAGFHHERIDGKGYPFGKKADEIPPVAQMIAVADTFDAMYSTRPYRTKMPLEKVIAELKRVSGTQLNEKYVNALLELIEEGKINEE